MLYSRHRYAAGRPVAQACPTLATPWAVARQAPLSMGSSRQEYWSGLLFPSTGHLPDSGLEHTSSSLLADSLPTVPSEKTWVSKVALVVENPPANAGDTRDTDSITGSGRSPGEGKNNPHQYSCLENSMDRRGWQATVHAVMKRL